MEYYENGNRLIILFSKLFVVLVCSRFVVIRGGEIEYGLVSLIVFAVSADLWDEDTLFKTAFYIGLGIVVVFFILSILEIVENNRGNSFGFVYRTDYSCHLLCLAMLWCLIKDGLLAWIGKIGLIAVTTYVRVVIDGKTSFICLVMLTVVTLFREARLKSIIKKAIPATTYIYIIVAGLSIGFALSYRVFRNLWRYLPGLATFKDRIVYGLLALEEYPITMLGNYVPQAGAGLSEKYVSLYFFIDNSYVKLLVIDFRN